ncbi:transcription factor bHLH18-like [Chenopodium quinoa]|uniref:transcription factor bHLH18-like n=1 Tax=Chenopodium quinoa TaxID=63459 RepID=UPI000B776075|nr:transcription factor bHLH18-like [Chenopodium quinoa]
MEVSMFSGYPDLGMMNNDLNYFHNQLQVNLLDELLGSSLPPSYGNNNSFDQTETNQGLISSKRSPQTDLNQTTFVENPIKKMKTNNWDTYDHQMNHVLNSQDQHDSNSTMLSFSNSSNSSISQTSSLITPKEEAVSNNNNNVNFPFHHEMVVNQASKLDKQSCIFESRPHQVVDRKNNIKVGSMPSQAMDHIIAERKRREKLSQRFIALSAVIPGLKKMDKASVLGDAIKYVKQMQEKVKKLEEEAKKKSVESAVFVKRSYVSAEDNTTYDQISAKSAVTDAAGSCCEASLPEIEVRFSDKDVLITVHCEQKKGIFEKLISQIEKLHLAVTCSSSLAFGGSVLAVTITAQMESEYSLTAKDLVRHLHSTLK